MAVKARNSGLKVFLFDEANTTLKAAQGDFTSLRAPAYTDMGRLWEDNDPLALPRLQGAKKRKEKKANVDAKAAALLLQSYFGNPNAALEVRAPNAPMQQTQS